MYDFLLKKLKPSYAKAIMSLWYALLMILIILLASHSDKADFIYLHL